MVNFFMGEGLVGFDEYVSTGFNKINILQKLCPWATCSSGIWELGVSIRKWGGVSKTYADLLHFTVFELVAVSFYGGL